MSSKIKPLKFAKPNIPMNYKIIVKFEHIIVVYIQPPNQHPIVLSGKKKLEAYIVPMTHMGLDCT